MKRISLLFLAACGSVTTAPPHPGEAPDAGVAPTPDAPPVPPMPDAGTIVPMPDGGTTSPSIAVISASVKDERGDAISFASGKPIHTHAGPVVDLGGIGCPDVYLYPYLLEAAAPPWGGETSANPLAWRLAITGGTAQYRVRGDDGTSSSTGPR